LATATIVHTSANLNTMNSDVSVRQYSNYYDYYHESKFKGAHGVAAMVQMPLIDWR
jgi:hypothetical protein